MNIIKKLYESSSAEETAAWAENVARSAKPGDVFALTGPLGAGKTVFSQGFARGLGCTGPVNSPTFTLMQSYEDGRLPLYHFDLYRLPGRTQTDSGELANLEALESIGYEDYWYADGVCLIEWADRAADLLPPYTQWITIAYDGEKNGDYRRITHSHIIKESGKAH